MPNVSLVASRCALFVGLGVSPIRAPARTKSFRLAKLIEPHKASEKESRWSLAYSKALRREGVVLSNCACASCNWTSIVDVIATSSVDSQRHGPATCEAVIRLGLRDHYPSTAPL